MNIFWAQTQASSGGPAYYITLLVIWWEFSAEYHKNKLQSFRLYIFLLELY